MKILVIGAGISGAIIARKFAEHNHKVLILEKRKNIAGNMFDEKIEGIHIQKYGPHIFHTNKKKVFEHMNQFWKLNNYINRCEATIDKKTCPIPFNFKGIDIFFKSKKNEIKNALIKKYGKGTRISIYELMKTSDPLLAEVADFVYKNIFENYTTKMWGTTPGNIDKSVLKRVPIALSYEDRYFKDKYEGIPIGGYTRAISKILDHENIEVKLNTDANSLLEFRNSDIFFRNKKINYPVIFSGQIDRLFNYQYGILPYRSLKIEFEIIKKEKFQNLAVVNYPSHPTMTRITEYKYFLSEKSSSTVISREYPGAFSTTSIDFNEPYYPLATKESYEKYLQYFEMSKNYNNFFLLGRLAEFKYINMDQAIENALHKYTEIAEIYNV